MIVLQEISEKDYEFLYQILKERETVQSITHTKIPSFDEHVNFIKSKPYTKWYIILEENKKIGTVYISQQDEIGIFIEKEFQSKGIGKKSLEELIKKNPRKQFYANVNPKNLKSVKFFEDFGFKLIQQTYELTY